MESVNFKVVKPQITSKQFVKNSEGNYVLSYSLSHANIQNITRGPAGSPVPMQGKPPSAWSGMMNRLRGRKPQSNNSTKLTTVQNVMRQQRQLEKTVPMSNKTRVMNVLNTKPCA